MSTNNSDWLEPELRAAGSAVARLDRPVARKGLAQRTLERVAQIKPLRRKILLLRPITHPLARIAAVAMLMVMTVPLTDLDVVASLGSRIENNVVGPKVVDRVEALADELLVQDKEGYSQSELDALTGFHKVNFSLGTTKKKVLKPRANERA